MANWRTLRRAVQEDYRISLGGDVDEQLNRAVCAALRDVRPLEFPWNTGTFTFDTIADQSSYAIATKGGATANLLRWDFFGVLGKEISLLHEKTAGTVPRILEEWDGDQTKVELWTRITSGLPDVWSYYDNKLWLGPQAPDSIDEIEGRCLLDLETPYPSADASFAWTYIGADGAAVDTDTFTNSWFTEALDVLEHRTAWRFYTTHDRDAKAAAAALASYDRALADLERQRGPKQVIGRGVPFLGGAPQMSRDPFYNR